MKTLYSKTKTWALGMAIVCLSAVGSVTAQPAPGGGGPANDDCANAIAIACGGTATGTTVGATLDNAGTCTTSNTAPGVWYTFVGNGGNVTASLCTGTNYDSKLSVYTGSCGAFVCVTGNDDACGAQSEVSFTSVDATTYYILVHGFSSGTGNFELNVTCPPPANNLCADAQALSCGDAVSGTTVNADATGQPTCLTGASPGVWYSFVGDGTDYIIDVTAPGFDPVIVVTSSCGGACDVLEVGTGSVSATVTATTIGATYYVYVLDNFFNEMLFDLALSSSACTPPANDDCANATPIACGGTATGSTVNATVDNAGTCVTTNTAPGVWYSFAGDGSEVTASLCANTDYDSKLSVYTGSCGSFTCVTGVDDGCGTADGEVTFSSIPGTTYYILVHGFSSGTGNYELNVTCAAPANDVCGGAIALACGDVVTGATSAATDAGQSDCFANYNTSINGLWYSFVGDGTAYDISMTSSDLDPVLAITTSCTPLATCEDFNDDANGLNSLISGFATTIGTTYYINAGDLFNGGGSFELSITSSACEAPTNDDCANAIALACGDVVSGSTSFATADSEVSGVFCGTTSATAPGVWYTVVGTGLDITASLCGSSYDTKLFVYEGACGSLTCVGGNDDACGLQSELTWTSTLGTTYSIWVTGFSSATGDFDLTITCATPANDLCADALPIACGDVVFGNNYNSTVSVDENCAELNAGNGVWYSFVGTGEDVTVSTCGAGTNFDTELVVTTGDCANQTCLIANDDECGLQSTVTFYGEPGVTYNIYVSNFDDEFASVPFGEFELSVTCACPTVDAGTLTADATPVCLTGGTATISATVGTAPTVPAGYEIAYVLTDGDSPNLDILDVVLPPAAVASFDVTAGGNYIIHTLVFNPADGATILGETTGVGVAGLIGSGAICASLDVAGTGLVTVEAPDAGTLTADASPVCLDAGSADISATENAAPVVPAGYSVLYVLTSNPGLIIEQVAATPDFTVTAEGDYIIHTLVYNPATLDLSGVVLGTTSALDVLPSLVQGGGSICANLDAAGAPITVELCGPANDLCSGAIAVTCGSTTSGTTVGSTADDAPFGTAYVSEGVWYVLAGTGDEVTASTCDAADFDTEIVIATGSCGNLTYLANNDDDFTNCTGNTSQVTFDTEVGTDYYIYVGDYFGSDVGPGGNEGTFDLSITCTPPPPAPSNDDACSAEPLALGANGPFTNVGATVEGGTEVIPGGGTGVSGSCQSQDGWCSFSLTLENTIWFSFVAPASGNVIVSTDGSDFDTQLAVYSAVSCQDLVSGTAVLEGANDDNPDALGSTLTSEVVLCGLTPGETYFVQVDGYDGEEGDATVTLTETTVDAGFTYAATGLSVAFTDASTTSSTIVEWAWDFGDGNTADIADPTNVYALDGPYTVCLTVTDENGCTSEYCEAIQVTDIPTTIAEAVERGMEVYPNPSNGQFVVEVAGVEADVQIVVLDVAGRQVYNEGVTLNNSFRKDLNLDVASGTYFLQVATLEGLVTRKIQIH